MTSLHKALLVLESMRGDEKYSLSEIAARSVLPVSSIHRLLQTLKKFDYVNQDADSKKYYLGAGLIVLGKSAEKQIKLTQEASPVLRQLADASREDAYLVVARGNEGVFLLKEEGPSPLKIIESYSNQVGLHCGATKKVLLAFKAGKFIDNYLCSELKRYTENTITDPQKLQMELEKIRENGYATSFAEFTPFGASIAAPVYDSSREVAASIGIIGPLPNFTEQNVVYLIDIVRGFADKLSRKIGFY